MAATLGRKYPADACAKGEESGSDSSREAIFGEGKMKAYALTFLPGKRRLDMEEENAVER